MQVTEISVSAGRTFNHPYENFSNLKPHLTLKATLDEGEDPVIVAKDLQAKAEQLVEDHKQNMLKSLEELHNLTLAQQEMMSLERQLKSAQERIDELRKDNPQLEIEDMRMSE